MLTWHAQVRMGARRMTREVVDLVLAYGRLIYARGAHIYVIGRKEIEAHRNSNEPLDHLDGVQVVCSSDGAVLTVYRHHDFSRLRPRYNWRRRQARRRGDA